MLHGSSILASRREERVQKAALVDHHGPGDARLSHSAIRLFFASKATMCVRSKAQKTHVESAFQLFNEEGIWLHSG